MAEHAKVAFRRELDKLFRRRTHWLRGSVEGPRAGAPLSLNRGHVRNSIARLQGLASDALAKKLARVEFHSSVRDKRSWHPKRGKGRGLAFHMKEHGLTEILTYDRKHFARVPWVQIGDL